MNLTEFVAYQVEDAGYQLSQTLAGFPTESVETAVGTMMSAKDILIHLTECYLAAVSALNNDEFKWGQYSPAESSWEAILKEFGVKREAAAQMIAAKGEEGAKTASMYVIAHDYYHVGQLASIRLSVDPNWDAFSIYRH